MARKKVAAPQQESVDLAETIAGFYDDPLGFVLFAFPWGQAGTSLQDEDGPDVWQARYLLRLGDEVKKRSVSEAVEAAIRVATTSGHGTGKTTLVSWVILWFISTRVNPQIVVTANTAAQLTGKTWRELAKWHKLAIHRDWFQWTATKFYLKEQPEDWFAVAQPWSAEKSEAFAGTHEKDVLIIFDEGSGVDDTIWEVAEGAMTTAGAMWLVFGNPTKNTGRFRECWRKFKHRWIRFKVDSRDAKKANKKQIEDWIEDYGEDSDFVRIRVKGQFPRTATNQLIAEDLVIEAMRRYENVYGDPGRIGHNGGPPLDEWDEFGDIHAAKIISIDVARFGDDQSVIGLRRGRFFKTLAKYREMDSAQLAHRIGEWIDEVKPDAVFIDADGIGGPVCDMLRNLGYAVEEVRGGLPAADKLRYFNKRAEMWWAARDWLKNNGHLEPDDEMKDDLIAVQYGYAGRTGQQQLERKEDMKKNRGLPSPDCGDCLAMSFFMPVSPAGAQDRMVRMMRGQQRARTSWMAN